MADYSGMEMEQLHEIATAEMQNSQPVMESAQLWGLAPGAFGDSAGALGGATGKLGEDWPDDTFEEGFKAPVDKSLASIRNSEQIVSGAKPDQALQQLSGVINTTGTQVEDLYQQWLQLKQILEMLQAMAAAGMGAIVAALIQQIMQMMEQLRMQAAQQVNTLAGGYQQATSAVQAAGQGHSWNGPAAGSPPSPSADSDELPAARPFDTVTSFAPDGGQPGTTQTEQLRQAQLDAARAAAAEAASANAQSGDAGLAGGVATAPPPVTPPTPAPAAPPTTATPTALPVSGGVPVGRLGGYGVGMPFVSAASRRSGGPIPKAARVTGGLTSASTGQAPVLPAESTGSARTSAKGVSAGPLGAGAMSPMLSPLAMGKLQSLIGRLKPIVTQHGAPAGDEGRRAAGVPNALRGRTAREDTEFAGTNQRPRRSRKEMEEAPETVELLDEELWEVEQGTSATRPTR
jgi:hypothetical protein